MGHVSSIINFNSSNAHGQEQAPAEGWEPGSEVIRQILTMRRARAKFFDPDLFAEPAWDILLELYSADLSGVKISVSSTCIGSNVPYTTALRCIRRLKDKGLIRRVNDPHDARRVFLSLTERGSAGMRAYFQSIAQ
jgi:DNA-binding MarR family transcriptional regulator